MPSNSCPVTRKCAGRIVDELHSQFFMVCHEPVRVVKTAWLEVAAVPSFQPAARFDKLNAMPISDAGGVLTRRRSVAEARRDAALIARGSLGRRGRALPPLAHVALLPHAVCDFCRCTAPNRQCCFRQAGRAV